jgi:hypothetical protein
MRWDTWKLRSGIHDVSWLQVFAVTVCDIAQSEKICQQPQLMQRTDGQTNRSFSPRLRLNDATR